MPELDKPWAYPLVIVLVAGVVGGIYTWLKRVKWL
jgi:magnesium transporter